MTSERLRAWLACLLLPTEGMIRYGRFLVLALISLAAAFGQSTPPAITSQPASATANAGQSVSLSLTATGNPVPSIQWFKDGRAITGETKASLTFASVFGGDAGTYTATVSNVANGTSYTLTTAAAVLTVVTTPPTITTQPVSQTVVAGGNVTFSVTATGSEPKFYRWFFNEVEVAGATRSSLSLNGVNASDAGNFQAVVLNWGNQVNFVSAGFAHTMYLKDGTLWAAGLNSSGQLGDGTTVDRYKPVQVASGVRSVSTGSAHTMFIKNDGTLWAMGYNAFGQLGDGTTTNRSVPVQVAAGVVKVSTGDAHTIYIRSDGVMLGVGRNDYGQLGDGTKLNRNSPVQLTSGVKSISAGGYHTMFVSNQDELFAVGYNAFGQLGDGSTIDRSTPVLVQKEVELVSAGATHTMLVKTDGSLWAMGRNSFGQLGDGSRINRSSPVQVASGVVSVAASGPAVSSATGHHTMYVRSDGTLWAMGANGAGRLGDGTTVTQITPVQVNTSVASVSAGNNHTMFIKNDGTLWALGYNSSGQLGDGSTIDRGSPIRVAGGVASNVATLAVNTPPFITTHPSSTAATIGLPFTLTVVAAGSPTPAYQWRKSGINIPNATNASYSVPSATGGDAGMYTVIVSNSVSSTTSGAAVVTVSAAAPAVITGQPTSVSANIGQSVTFSIAISGSPLPSIQWLKNGVVIPGATASTYEVFPVTQVDGATYSATIQNAFNGATYRLTSAPAVLTVIAMSRLINLSILTSLDAGEVMTLGTVLGGSGTLGTKAMLLRGAGPSLAQLGVPGFMPDPFLDFYRGQLLTASNDNWGGGGALISAFSAVGAFAYAAPSSLDAAVYSPSLQLGGYTVQIRGVGSSSGVVLAELYDATPAALFTTGTPRLINVSVLKEIRIGETLTAGFVIGGEGSKRILIRAVGPTLGQPPFNIAGVMADPRLTLYSGQQVVATNDNWGSQSSGITAAQLSAIADGVGAFKISNDSSRDAVLLVTLSPGNYTAQVSAGSGGGGFVITEVYEVP